MKWIIATLILGNLVIFYLYQYGMLGGVASQPSVLPAAEQGNRLQLIDEHASQAAPVVIAQAPAPVVEPRSCYTVEKLTEQAAEALLAKLDAAQLAYQREGYQQDEIANFWVFVPALPNLAEARKLHKRIRSLGVKDVYVIEAGKNRNIVSLGLYSDQASADERVTWFNRKGVAATVTERYKAVDYSRVELDVTGQPQQEKLEQILRSEPQALTYQKNPCK